MTISYIFKNIRYFLSDWKLLRLMVWHKVYLQGYLPLVIEKRQARYVEELRQRDHVNVVFLPMDVAMWKYQHLYELFKADKRFRVYVFLTPSTTFARDQQIANLRAMRAYFGERGMEYVDYELEQDKPMVDIRSVVEPDIIFYTQPYETVIDESRSFIHFHDKLLCYAPYAFLPRKMDQFFDLPFDGIAWRLYYQTDLNKEYSQAVSKNKGRNVVVAGYPGADDYFTPLVKEVWQSADRSKKRVIWAPHFTIDKNSELFAQSYFLEMAEIMRELAVEYADRIVFAFKPHPRLYSELCIHPEWGKERAQEYYDFWAHGENTQLETGDFVDLFKGSDAMIHDCGSFIMDYLYFNKPVLYDNPDIEAMVRTADELGVKAYDAHYRVKTLSDIRTFLDEVVLGGKDTMAPVRKAFFDAYLQPKDGKSASQFIYDDIVRSIWKDEK